MYHVLTLLTVGLPLARYSVGGSPWLSAAGWLFVAGTILFSGSLYALSLSGVRVLGAITPLGGVAFLLGRAALTIGVWRRGCPAKRPRQSRQRSRPSPSTPVGTIAETHHSPHGHWRLHGPASGHP